MKKILFYLIGCSIFLVQCEGFLGGLNKTTSGFPGEAILEGEGSAQIEGLNYSCNFTLNLSLVEVLDGAYMMFTRGEIERSALNSEGLGPSFKGIAADTLSVEFLSEKRVEFSDFIWFHDDPNGIGQGIFSMSGQQTAENEWKGSFKCQPFIMLEGEEPRIVEGDWTISESD
jgi:hypothetical protein